MIWALINYNKRKEKRQLVIIAKLLATTGTIKFAFPRLRKRSTTDNTVGIDY
jgi:hypothetical protein